MASFGFRELVPTVLKIFNDHTADGLWKSHTKDRSMFNFVSWRVWIKDQGLVLQSRVTELAG